MNVRLLFLPVPLAPTATLADSGALVIESSLGVTFVPLSLGQSLAIPALSALLLGLLVLALVLAAAGLHRGRRWLLPPAVFLAALALSGLAPEHRLANAQSIVLQTDPTQVVFVESGERRTVRLSNPAGVTVPINAIFTTGRFRHTHDCSAQLPPGWTCEVVVEHDPTLCTECEAGMCVDGVCRVPDCSSEPEGPGCGGGGNPPEPEPEPEPDPEPEPEPEPQPEPAPEPEPEPEPQFAPPLDPTTFTSHFGATAFLYSGDAPVQRGVQPGTIEERRVAVIRGNVRDRAGEPLPGVTVTIKGHPEYGHTLTREDGVFDLAVNGGGVLVVDYQKAGYLPSQRQVRTPWQDYVWAEDVVLIALDAVANPVDLGGGAGLQIARGAPVADADGERTATLIFPPGVRGEMVLPDGTRLPLAEVTVRATEYTVGESGPQAMPGELPPTSGYTYAAELSVDEAMAAGAREVRFDRPVYFYVDNFLGFPVGGIVPVGWYDRDKAAWIPSDNGRVIRILSIETGLAILDVTGSGTPSSASALGALGITEAERAALAELYPVGASLWRSPVQHFTPWDCNWPYGPPNGALPPQVVPETESEVDVSTEVEQLEEEPECEIGSIIECQNQVLGQHVPLVGTPFGLNYRSDRTPGRKAAYSISIPLSGITLPPNVRRIELQITVAGRRIRESFQALLNQTYSFSWDGLDAFGRKVRGTQRAAIEIGYVYPAVYRSPATFARSFAIPGTSAITGSRLRDEVTLWRNFTRTIGAYDARVPGLGGWTLDVHHHYDPVGRVLLKGSGQRRSAAALPSLTAPFAGTGQAGYSGDGGLATNATLRNAYGGIYIDVAEDGSVYIYDRGNHVVRRVDSKGIITTVAGNGIVGYTGDGGNARSARLNANDRGRITVAPGGVLYIAQPANNVIRRVDPNGIIRTIAGNGSAGFSGDGGPARQAQLNKPIDVAVAPDGSLYIAEFGNHRVRRVDPNGIISTVVGTGLGGNTGDNGSAAAARIYYPMRIELGDDGSLYIDGHSNTCCHGLIRKVTPDGIIRTVLQDARQSNWTSTDPVLLRWKNLRGRDGSRYWVSGQRVMRMAPPLPGFDGADIPIPSADGSEVFLFNPEGRHQATLDSASLATLYRFEYDASGRLGSVVGSYGNATRVERTASGLIQAIIAPDGQRTELVLNAAEYIAAVRNPAAERHEMTYTADGLLTSFVKPNGSVSSYAYDLRGRLESTSSPNGGGWTLARSEWSSGYEAGMTSAEGRTTRYRVQRQSDGSRLRTNTRPGGQVDTTRISTGGHRKTLSDGTVIDLVRGADPRFKMAAPVPSTQTVTTPSGRVLRLTTARLAVLADAASPLSHSRLDETRSENGRITRYRYVSADRTWTTTSPEGRAVVNFLGEHGAVELQQADGLAPVTYTRDARGRLTRLAAGEASERITDFAWDEAGQLAAITDPLARTTSFEHDAAGRLTRQTLPDGSSVVFGYDANGNLASLIPPGRDAHLFDYTPADDLAEYDPPALSGLATVTRHTYNLDRQLTRITRPDGETIDLAYDAAGRLASVTSDVGTTTTTAYHATTGRIASLTAPNGHRLAYTWDGPLPLTETATGEVAGSITRTWDNNFWLRSLSLNGSPITLDYDNDGLLTRAGTLTLTRHAQHGLVTATSLGTVTSAHTHNAFGEALRDTTRIGPTEVLDFTYTRDPSGRITERTETLAGVSATDHYAYDEAGRLIGHTRSGIATTWGYDANGNRSHVNGTPVATYDEQDRLLTYGSTGYDYTENGELRSRTTGGATTTFDYDALGNLRQVTLPGEVTIDYLIDARNRRIGKRINGTLVQGFLYQDQLNPIAELDGQGNLTARFIYADKAHVPAYMVRNGNTYRIISDHLGSPRLVIDTASGDIAQRVDYDPWGRILLDTNPGFQPFGFAGGLYDAHTGLVRFGARDYDPGTGRWTAKDPIGFGGGDSNLYGYVLGNPVNNLDPYGTEIVTVHIGVELPFVGGFDFGLMADTGWGGSLPDFGVFSTLKKSKGGFGRFKGTVGVSMTQGERCDFDGSDAEFGIGLGAIGGTIGGANAENVPTSVSVEMGPQLGVTGNFTQTASITVGDIARLAARVVHGSGGGAWYWGVGR